MSLSDVVNLGSDKLSTGKHSSVNRVVDHTSLTHIKHLPPSPCSADSTGTHSLYTTYKDYEIMFHVSTMLPYTPNNKQQVGCPQDSAGWTNTGAEF